MAKVDGRENILLCPCPYNIISSSNNSSKSSRKCKLYCTRRRPLSWCKDKKREEKITTLSWAYLSPAYLSWHPPLAVHEAGNSRRVCFRVLIVSSSVSVSVIVEIEVIWRVCFRGKLPWIRVGVSGVRVLSPYLLGGCSGFSFLVPLHIPRTTAHSSYYCKNKYWYW